MMFSGIEVPDMDKAKAFYIDALGLKIALQIGRPCDPVHELALTFRGNPTWMLRQFVNLSKAFV